MQERKGKRCVIVLNKRWFSLIYNSCRYELNFTNLEKEKMKNEPHSLKKVSKN